MVQDILEGPGCRRLNIAAIVWLVRLPIPEGIARDFVGAHRKNVALDSHILDKPRLNPL